jgi:hypothetical protein
MKSTLLAAAVLAAGATIAGAVPQAPPPAWRSDSNPNLRPDGPVLAGGTILWNIGNPTDEEQYYLELLNRARLDPQGEANLLVNTTNSAILGAYNFFKVDLTVLQTAYQSIAPVAPLAFEPRLTTAARGHSAWMLANGVQQHSEGTVTPGNRATAAGYPWNVLGENIFAYADEPFSGFAGFEVDWGNGPSGMQNPPGHRENDHNGAFREIGIGVVDGSNTVGANSPVGPQLVTFDLGSRPNLPPLVTGVAYYDLNGNGMFDPGEGIPGIRADVSGSTYYAVSTNSGGFAVPGANGSQTVTFTGPGVNQALPATIAGGANVKVDLRLTYAAPAVLGPATAFLNALNTYSAAAVPAATGYSWLVESLAPVPSPWGAEQGTQGVITNTTAGYDVVSSDVAASGIHAYHLAMPTAGDQVLELAPKFVAGQSPSLAFSKLLGFSSTAQHAEAQISTDDGRSWTTVWSQPGYASNSGSVIDHAFVHESVLLAIPSGGVFRVRFLYSYDGNGGYVPGSAPVAPGFNVGLYLDDITVGGAQIVSPVLTNVSASPAFVFAPTNAGAYAISVAPLAGIRALPVGPVLLINTTNAPPPVVLGSSSLSRSGPNLILAGRVTSGKASTVTLESASSVAGPYTATGTSAVPDGAGAFTFTIPPAVGGRFFRVRGQ